MGGTGCCRNDGKRVEGTFALKTMSLRLHSMIVSQKKKNYCLPTSCRLFLPKSGKKNASILSSATER